MALTKISRSLLDTGISDSSDATAITIDSSERVGIGASSPDSPLEIDGGSSANTVLHLTSTTANTFLKISDSNTNEGNFIGCTTDDLTFFTKNTERMRVQSDGDFFLNTTSAMDNCFASFQDGNNGEAMVGISAKNDNNVGIRFGVGTTRKWVNYRDTSDNLIWYSNAAGAERVRFYSGGGITFNGDNAAANALDDYEEGSWTPRITSTTGTAMTTGINCTYTRVGRLVTIRFDLTNDTGSDTAAIYGLPFTSEGHGGVKIVWNNMDSSEATGGYTGTGSIILVQSGTDNGWTLTNGKRVIGFGTYFTTT